jgi:SAM-dependent methyltransferase
MTSLKRKLYAISPLACDLSLRLYGSTALAKRRRADALRRISTSLAARLPQELELLRKMSQGDLIVLNGPFRGMRYMASSSGSMLGAKLIGSYESQLQKWLEEAIAADYDRIVDIGCAEGFYAVGLALKLPSADVIAFDTNPEALRLLRELAALNGVGSRIDARAECTPSLLRTLATDKTLIVCDIEGAEAELFPDESVAALATTDAIIECHDDQVPGITQRLIARFAATHRIEMVVHERKEPSRYPQLAALSASEAMFLLDEKRVMDQCWLRLLSYARRHRR